MSETSKRRATLILLLMFILCLFPFFLAFMAFTSYFCRSSNKIQLLKWYLTKGFILNAWTTNVNTFGIVYVQQNKALTEALFMLCGLLNVDNCMSAVS